MVTTSTCRGQKNMRGFSTIYKPSLVAFLYLIQGIFGDSKLKTVQAFTGESVILPCYTDVIDDTTTVEWSKEGTDQHVLVYRQGCEIHEEKDPVFWYRSSLIMDKWRHGNISLRISDLKLSDAGKYRCKTIHKQIQRSIVVDLIVGAVSEPKLSVFPSTDAGVTLQCEVPCWFPKPDITFLDGAGKEMSAQNEKFEQRSEGCFSVRGRVTLQTTTNSVTCLVNEQSLNQSKVEKFKMPGQESYHPTETTSYSGAADGPAESNGNISGSKGVQV